MNYFLLFLLYIYFSFRLIYECLENSFKTRRKCKSNTKLDGKVVIITGANTGIGKETAYQLSMRRAKVIIGCRDLEKAGKVVEEIKLKNSKADIIALKLDLSSLKSVRHFAKTVSHEVTQIDILINNAGVMLCPEWETEDGFEMQFGVNHLGHFLLTLSLLPLLKMSSKARIITISSVAYILGEINLKKINLRNGCYDAAKAYSQSKLANILFTRELGKRLGSNSNVKTYCLHPGLIKTDLNRHIHTIIILQLYRILRLFTLDIKMGAQTTLYCALEKSIENESGFYYDNCKRVDYLLWNAMDDKTSAKLWELSSDLVKLESYLRI